MKFGFFLAVLGILGILVLGTIGLLDYSVQLPNGYSLDRIYSHANLITGPPYGDIAIHANVDKYQVIGDLILGHVTQAERSPEKELSRPGYFFIDTKTKTVIEGLNEQEWLNHIEKAGVKEKPNLKAPSRFDAIF
ncbi:MAG: hypothetical protein Kow0029_07810 [Candidatus Rifleibacteriota bacterium]